jgi:5-methylcytosine-specific restriction endonuclease McrA
MCKACYDEKQDDNIERSRKWRSGNPEKSIVMSRRYRKENPDKTAETLKKRKQRYIEECGSEELYYKLHYQRYQDTFKESSASRRSQCPPWVDKSELRQIYEACPEGHHVDHIHPIKGITPEGWPVSGLHVPWNLQYLPAVDNIRKKNRVQPEDLNAVF